MEIVLLWLLTQMITKASEKWKVSQTYISIWLAILLWAWYYVATTYYNVQRQQLVERVWWVYASSQLFYNVFKKAWLLEDKKGE